MSTTTSTKDSAAQYSELAVYSKIDDAKEKLPWYVKNLDKYLVPDTRRFLKEYAGVAEEEHSRHIHDIRDQAWAIRAYPCTGTGIFYIPVLPQSVGYGGIMDRLKNGGVLMDVGCHLGTEMRRLAYDGAPSENMYGVDIVSHWDVGFKLFRDEGRFKGKFIKADILDDKNEELNELVGKADVINVGAVMHQWDWNTQVKAAKSLAKFSKLGTLIVGYQVGVEEVEERESPFAPGVRLYTHNPASWERMWKLVADETGTKWSVKSELKTWDDLGWDWKDQTWLAPTTRIIVFVVEREE